MSHTAKLDELVDSVQELLGIAEEDGFDEAAQTLENVLENLQSVQFDEREEADEAAEEE